MVLTPSPEDVTVPGTPFTAENMNHIEDGIADAHAGITAEAAARAQADAELQLAINTLAPEGAENLPQLLAGKAPLNSPAFTGTPTAPTAASSANNTQIATTAFVQSAAQAKINAIAFGGGIELYGGTVQLAQARLGAETGDVELFLGVINASPAYAVGTHLFAQYMSATGGLRLNQPVYVTVPADCIGLPSLMFALSPLLKAYKSAQSPSTGYGVLSGRWLLAGMCAAGGVNMIVARRVS